MNATLTLLCTLLIHCYFGQATPLFKITQNDRVGYINNKGVVVIQPVFLSGNDFSEGLAAVRLNGTYGFINESGIFVINPQYDFATSFGNGVALVYKNGVPLFIDPKGNVILPKVFAGLIFIDSRKAIVTTHTKKKGLIDIFTKQLLIDTLFSSIGSFTNGVAIVKEYISPAKEQQKERMAVIDSTGKFIVTFGKYETIQPFYDGYASVEFANKRDEDDISNGAIDTKGRLVFKKKYTNNSYFDGDFHDGLAKINLYKYWIPEEKGVLSTTEKSYQGFINLKGNVVLNNTKYRYVNNFSNGRAFIQEDKKDYILVDKNFKQIGHKAFRNIPSETFKNGYAIVETEDGYGIIDTAGNFITTSYYADIHRIGIVNGYFFFTNEKYGDKNVYGIANLEGTIICKPMLQDFDRNGFVNGLIKAVIDDRLCYINKTGAIVWQQQQEDTSTALQYLNIDFMNRGYFYAYSSPKNTAADYSNGWASSTNTPQKIMDKNFPDNSLAITIDSNLTDTFAHQFFGYQLFISNTTRDTIKFNAQDSRIYMKLQAQNNKGEWQDIEYLPSSWCGNSYHKIELEPNAFWNFTIPKYTGEIQTSIRAKLQYIVNGKLNTEKVLYSNIVYGSVNPGQFWNKRTYYSNGLMDPYND